MEQSLSAIVAAALRAYLDSQRKRAKEDMKTEGIEGWLIEAHNRGETVAFCRLEAPDGREVGVNAPPPESRRSRQHGERHGAR